MDIENIRKIKLNNGLSINYVLKDKEISKILKILENKIENVILKGGTGINRVYFNENNRRFSEDINFDIISKLDINELKENLYLKIKKELSKQKYIVHKPRLMKKTIRYDIEYINKIGKKDKIRLEFRTKEKVNRNYSKKIVEFGFVPYSSSMYNVYNISELINQKLFAFINRSEGKDIYDLFYLLDLKFNYNKINKKLINKSILKTKQIIKDNKLIKYITNSTNYYIRKELRNDFEIYLKELLRKLEEIKKR